MERTKWREPRLPDAIYRSGDKENFTQISNTFIRDANISVKAKTILIILLSNKKGWTSYNETIVSMMKEGITAVKSGLTELETLGYLKRIQLRHKDTKIRRGSFWAYTDTPGVFNYSRNLRIIEQRNLEIYVKAP